MPVTGKIYFWVIMERSSSSILWKRFLSPRRGSNPQPSDDRWDSLIIELPRVRWWILMMVRASHWSSEGCGFDPHLGFRNRFSDDRAWRMFIYHSRYLQAPPFPKCISQKYIQWIFWHLRSITRNTIFIFDGPECYTRFARLLIRFPFRGPRVAFFITIPGWVFKI